MKWAVGTINRLMNKKMKIYNINNMVQVVTPIRREQNLSLHRLASTSPCSVGDAPKTHQHLRMQEHQIFSIPNFPWDQCRSHLLKWKVHLECFGFDEIRLSLKIDSFSKIWSSIFLGWRLQQATLRDHYHQGRASPTQSLTQCPILTLCGFPKGSVRQPGLSFSNSLEDQQNGWMPGGRPSKANKIIDFKINTLQLYLQHCR